ncbi:uncharacterized protein LOC124688729 isoform X1 [Lolium rigidum]|uniref:uncharacterized protein LOC124688729 isoform X1 n=1 Tax=Lolium rigidum TaxID=89674 RepID=UPI001F5C7FD3|nr:uncharacterized protein LOC124688729 isoform X1 [Lolium rigidum]
MSVVLYKRSPPPPEPEEDDSYPRPPTSPSFECPEDSPIADDITEEIRPNAHFSDNGHRDLKLDNPGFLIADDFDSLYNEDCSFSKEDMERQSNQYATAALDHYNGQEKNLIKYELLKAITSSAIISVRGLYGHVNFTAKSTLENSKEEFFFAELCHDRDCLVYIPTCIVSLEGKERIGGVRGIKGNDGYYGMEIRVDTQYCYACDDELKHPEDGTLYEAGHQVDGFYDYC